MGQNIGTCVTAILSSLGAKKNAKTAALMHLLFNVIGTVLFSAVAIVYFQVLNPAAGLGLITQTQISTCLLYTSPALRQARLWHWLPWGWQQDMEKQCWQLPPAISEARKRNFVSRLVMQVKDRYLHTGR